MQHSPPIIRPVGCATFILNSSTHVRLCFEHTVLNHQKVSVAQIMVTVKAGSGWIGLDELELIREYASAFGKGLNYHYFIFSKGGFTEGLLQAQDRGEVRLLTLADIFK